MADIKWIKITTDIFDDEKILLIESMPAADSIIVIWFKLLCLAGKQNNSGVFMMSNRVAYTDEMLATIFRRDVNTVRLALNTFEQFGMIEIVDGVLTIPNWGKHQNLDQLEAKKEYMRGYMRTYREKQKLLTCKTNSKSKVSEADKNKNKNRIDKDIYISIVDFLNEKAGTAYKATSKKTQSLINARISEGFSLDDFKRVIENMCAEWLGNDKMQPYLRPETLFGTKFESYLNAKTRKITQAQHNAESNDLDGIL